MVKIVGRDETAVKHVTCRECASVLEYTKSEVLTQDNGRDIGGGSSGYTYVACPNGHHAIIRSW